MEAWCKDKARSSRVAHDPENGQQIDRQHTIRQRGERFEVVRAHLTADHVRNGLARAIRRKLTVAKVPEQRRAQQTPYRETLWKRRRLIAHPG